MTTKARIKQALRRLLEPVIHRLTAGVNARIDSLEAGWNRHVPTLLGAVSSVAAFGHELFGVRRDLERQIAALREEVAALAKKVDGADVRPAARVTPRIAAPEKVARIKANGLRLNLDGGRNPREEFVNVDADAGNGADVIAEPGNLPFEAASVAAIDAGSLLDRIAEEELHRRLLPFWLSLLVPGGSFRATVRDASGAIAALAAGTCSFEDFRAELLAQREDGFYRGNLFTPQSLSRLMHETGFVNITTGPLPSSEKRPALLEITAERPPQ